MRITKSPGEDEFTKESYETFFDLLCLKNLLNSYNEAFYKGILSVSQRRGTIILIPKGDVDLYLYSILITRSSQSTGKETGTTLTKANSLWSNRILLMRDMIGQNIRLLSNIMKYTDTKKIAGIFLLVDFEKAFDMLEWSFISRTLEVFNFGSNIKKWFTVL